MKDKMPWLRLYARMIDDEKIRLLAFEDRWHFVALLCLKRQGILDQPESDLKRRKIAVKMGLQTREIEEVFRRLSEVELTDIYGNPKSWGDLQFESDTSAERTRKYRERLKKEGVKRRCDVTVTAQDTDTDKDIGKTPQSKTHFKPPTLEQVQAYCREKNYTFDPERFHAHFSSCGWVLKGGQKMKCWKSACTTFQKNEDKFNPKAKTPQERFI